MQGKRRNAVPDKDSKVAESKSSAANDTSDVRYVQIARS